METLLALAAFSLVASTVSIKLLAGYFKLSGIVARDLHKPQKPLLPTSLGIGAFIGFYLGVLSYITLRVYYFHQTVQLELVLAAVLSVLLTTLVGFLDDLYSVRGQRIGLKQWQKPLLSFFTALPLVAVGAGMNNTVFFIHLHVLYPLLLLPVIYTGAANMVNMLAGFNGLEALNSLTVLAGLAYFALKFGAPLSAKIIIFSAIGAILGFLLWNKYPAKVLPGDSFTYFAGAVIGAATVLSDLEEPALILVAPYFLELLLKARGKFKKPTVGTLNRKGRIEKNVQGIYSIPHFFMNGRFTEPEVVVLSWLPFLVSLLLAIVIFR